MKFEKAFSVSDEKLGNTAKVELTSCENLSFEVLNIFASAQPLIRLLDNCLSLQVQMPLYDVLYRLLHFIIALSSLT